LDEFNSRIISAMKFCAALSPTQIPATKAVKSIPIPRTVLNPRGFLAYIFLSLGSLGSTGSSYV